MAHADSESAQRPDASTRKCSQGDTARESSLLHGSPESPDRGEESWSRWGEARASLCLGGAGVHFILSAAGNVPNIKKKSHALSLLKVSVRSRWVDIS